MFTRYDTLLIVGLLAVALLALGVIRYRAGAVDTVVVQVDGEEVIQAPLADDKRFSVDGPLGKTEVEIKDKRVRVTDSPCARKTCVHAGWIDKPYQTIICMPNHVVIRLTGKGDNGELDGITG
ncbi:NusG domain II-containing protein [Candidatus Poribacteria bacterium]